MLSQALFLHSGEKAGEISQGDAIHLLQKGDAFLMKLSQDRLTLLILGYAIVNRIKVILSLMAKTNTESVSPRCSSIQASFQRLFSELTKLE